MPSSAAVAWDARRSSPRAEIAVFSVAALLPFGISRPGAQVAGVSTRPRHGPPHEAVRVAVIAVATKSEQRLRDDSAADHRLTHRHQPTSSRSHHEDEQTKPERRNRSRPAAIRVDPTEPTHRDKGCRVTPPGTPPTSGVVARKRFRKRSVLRTESVSKLMWCRDRTRPTSPLPPVRETAVWHDDVDARANAETSRPAGNGAQSVGAGAMTAWCG